LDFFIFQCFFSIIFQCSIPGDELFKYSRSAVRLLIFFLYMQQVGNIPLRFRILKLQMAMMSPRSPTESPPPSPLWSQSPELLQPYLERPLTTCIELQPQRVWH